MMSALNMNTGIHLGGLLKCSGFDLALSDELAGLKITDLQLDSRKLQAGNLFLAVPGLQTDGRDYLLEAESSGAVIALAERENRMDFDHCEHMPVLTVDNLAHKISALAGCFYGKPSEKMSLLGITGTNGKTTCTQLLAQLFDALGTPSGVIGTLGYGLNNRGLCVENICAESTYVESTYVESLGDGAMDRGSESGVMDEALIPTGLTTPDAVNVQYILACLKEQGAEVVAMEVSSHSLDQGRVAGLSFKTAVFTNLSQDHLDYHLTMAAYYQAKSQLFQAVGLEHAIINYDDDAGRRLLGDLSRRPEPTGLNANQPLQCYSYSCHSSEADIYAENTIFSSKGMQGRIKTPWGSGEFHSHLQGEFNLSNLLAVIGVACVQGYNFEKVLRVLTQLQAVPGRLQLVDTAALPVVIVDYAHTSDALEKVLTTLRSGCKGRLWCVFGCGGDRDSSKRAVMGRVAYDLADKIIITSDNPRSEDAQLIIDDVLKGIPASAVKECQANARIDRRVAIRYAVKKAAKEDVVLIAGKGHECYQLIGSNRLPFNDVSEARLALRERDDC